MKLGWIADYLSRAVLVGFITGVAIVLIVGQLGKLFGLSIQNREPIPQLEEVVRELDGAQGLTIAIGLSAIVILLVLRQVAPGLPGPLIMVIAGIVASAVFDLQSRGVAVVGNIPAGLPSLRWPGVPFADVVALVPAALGIFAVGFADGILTARSFAGTAQPARRREPGAARARCSQRRRRTLAGLPDRGERLAHRGERPDGRPHPGRRSRARPR